MAESKPGVARGEFRVDTSSLRTAGQAIVQQSRLMVGGFQQAGAAADQFSGRAGSALNRVANSFRQAEERAKAFNKTDLGVIRTGLQNIASSLGAIVTTLGGAGIVKAGVGAAQQIARINALVNIFSGSTQKGAQRMAELRAIADRTGQSFLGVAEGALAILPAVGRNNVELGKTLSLVQRLAVLDPVQGVEGAAFALRELLGGDAKSLAGRFELPRAKLKEILDQAQGSPQAIIDGLDDLVNSIGLTSEKFDDMGKSGAYAFSRLQGTITEALGIAFTPFLNNVLIPMATKFGDFVKNLNETNPQLLQTASIFAIAAAGAAPLILVLSNLITAYKTLKDVSNSPIGSAIGKAGILAGAAGVGVAGGLGISRFLADRGVGDQRLRSDSGEDPGQVIIERIKQLVVIVGSGLSDFVAVLQTGAAKMANAVDTFVTALNLGVGLLKNAIALQIAQLAQTLYNLGLTDIAEQLAGTARGLLVLPSELQTLKDRLQLLNSGEPLRKAEEQIGSANTQRKSDLVNFLFPERLEQAGQDAAESLEAVAEATNPVADALIKNQEAIEETATKISEINEAFDEETRRMQEERDIGDSREAFDRAQNAGRDTRDRERNRAREDADFAARLREGITEQLGEIEAQGFQQRLKLIDNFNEESARRAEEHGLRLEEIERRTTAAVQNAAASLDANAVFEALATGTEQTNAENSSFDRETEQRRVAQEQQLADLQASIAQQKSETAKAYAEQVQSEINAMTLRRQREDEDRAIRAADEEVDRLLKESRDAEDEVRSEARRKAARDKEIAAELAALAQTTGINQQILTGLVTTLAAAGGHILSFAGYVNSIAASLVASAQQYGPQTAANSPAPPGNIFTAPFGFASGGRPSVGQGFRANENGLESALINNRYLALLTQPAQVMDAEATRSLMAGGGGGKTVTITGNTFAPNFGDIGQYSEAKIMDMFWTALDEWADDLIAVT